MSVDLRDVSLAPTERPPRARRAYLPTYLRSPVASGPARAAQGAAAEGARAGRSGQGAVEGVEVGVPDVDQPLRLLEEERRRRRRSEAG